MLQRPISILLGEGNQARSSEQGRSISLEDGSFDDFFLFVECQAVDVIEAMSARLLSLNLDS